MMDWPNDFGLITFETIDSTNKEASRRVNETSQPTWILSYEQTSGIGRRGRRWSSQKGNFSATLLMPISGSLSTVALHSFVASLALRDTLIHITNEPERFSLKWPNDVLLRGGKVAGILLESAVQSVGMDHLAIGIGVNLAAAPTVSEVEEGAVRPVSLRGELGVTVSVEDFLDLLASAFARYEDQFQTYGFAPIRRAWMIHAARLGEVITARTAREEWQGTFREVDETGQLVLETSQGRIAIPAADVYF
jgi:BirA family biotin operon repressor/biotin-[acetyl-CoA-carboxylase] ligase